jgi:Leucine-rich repeat (LRR) protein/tRNA A-37 threonylcarbamoyl transferase component Bud32
MTQPSLCPSAHDLEQFLAGRLAVAQSEELAAHFLDCPHCLETAHNLLKAGDTLSDSLRGQSGAGLPNNSQLRELIQRLKALPPASEQTQAEVVRPPDAHEATLESCTFLAPAEGPGEIGRLGTYRLLKVLGQGGMGIVFEAEDARLKRRVALKVMRPSVAVNPAARQRFLREAQSAASLTHDHIIAIYQVDEINNAPFLAMPILQGEALDDRLKREQRLPVAEVLRIGRETAEGLAAAHEHGLIHRDIKPGNLWLEGPRGRVKLLDFGLARVAAADVQITQSGAIVGTPAYMAPEQARGERVDGRCDLFSLGCVLYRAATGELPFRGRDTMSMLLALATDQPPPPRQINPDIPKPLADLILQLLAKDPKDRPASARMVAERLEAMEREPVGAAKAAAPPGRRWLIAGAVAAVFLGGLIALTIVIVRDKHGKEMARVTVPDGGSVEVKDDGVPKPDAAVKEASPADERRAAEWVRSKGGSIAILAGDQMLEIAPGAALPAGEWRLEGIHLNEHLNDADLVRLEGLTRLRWLRLRNIDVTSAGLAHLEGLTNLDTLDLEGTSVTDDGLKHLRRMSRLKHLFLNDRRITDAGLEYFKQLTSLERLALHGMQITAAGLAHLGELVNLTELYLGESSIGDAHLEQLGRLPKLTLLGLANTRVSDAGLEQLKRLTNLKQLDLHGTPITDTGLAHLQPLKQLERLNLGGTKVSDAGPKFLQPLNLNQLDLRETAVGDPGLKHLRTLKNLSLLYMGGTRVSDAGLADLAALNWEGGQLELIDTRISAKGIASLRAALPKVQLTWSERNRGAAEVVLALGGTVHVRVDGRADDRLVKTAAEMPAEYFRVTRVNLAGVTKPLHQATNNLAMLSDPDFDNLQVLDLSGSQDYSLSKFKAFTSLTDLSLARTRTSDPDLAALKEFKHLTDLSLARTGISDDGLAALKECKHLRRLVLDGTPVVGFGLEHLKGLPELRELRLGCPSLAQLALASRLGELKQLEILSLAGSAVNDDFLKALRGLDQLRELDLSGTKATEAGVAELRKARPKCKVVFGPAANDEQP